MRGDALSGEDRELLAAAHAVRLHAHAPYSRFRVGAALRTAEGAVIVGCNVENVVLGETVCAEKSAIVGGVSQGHQRFQVVAIVTDHRPAASPCGSCRQMLFTWGVERVILANLSGEVEVWSLADLLPRSFVLELP